MTYPIKRNHFCGEDKIDNTRLVIRQSTQRDRLNGLSMKLMTRGRSKGELSAAEHINLHCLSPHL